jgi:hypothetical protein
MRNDGGIEAAIDSLFESMQLDVCFLGIGDGIRDCRQFLIHGDKNG